MPIQQISGNSQDMFRLSDSAFRLTIVWISYAIHFVKVLFNDYFCTQEPDLV